jgi:hypothetical protein
MGIGHGIPAVGVTGSTLSETQPCSCRVVCGQTEISELTAQETLSRVPSSCTRTPGHLVPAQPVTVPIQPIGCTTPITIASLHSDVTVRRAQPSLSLVIRRTMQPEGGSLCGGGARGTLSPGGGNLTVNSPVTVDTAADPSRQLPAGPGRAGGSG